MSKRLIYCDSTLRNNVGHFANACRAIVKSAVTHGYTVSVHGARDVEPDLQRELDIIKTFKWGLNPNISTDPIIGWLLDYYLERDQMCRELATIEIVGAGDLMFVNSCTAPKVAGILAWMTERTRRGASLPDVFFETPLPPGIRADDPATTDPAATPAVVFKVSYLYRLAFTERLPENDNFLFPITFDPLTAFDYARIWEFPVHAAPVPFLIDEAPRVRASTEIQIAFLGHQRRAKGFHLVPELTSRILQECGDNVKVLIHDVSPSDMTAEHAALDELAVHNDRVTITRKQADNRAWSALLAQSDLIVLPYSPQRYRHSYSAIMVEAVVSAIPMVVPSNTSISATLDALGGPCTAFDSWDVATIFSAVKKAIDGFDTLVEAAVGARANFKERAGPDNFLRHCEGVRTGLRKGA
ncbi:MAG: hypothetical protein VX090_17310 [Pseudomonadota bacterium]|nr:hypothetical protein [Pseudomonadota bacterium]